MYNSIGNLKSSESEKLLYYKIVILFINVFFWTNRELMFHNGGFSFFSFKTFCITSDLKCSCNENQLTKIIYL